MSHNQDAIVKPMETQTQDRVCPSCEGTGVPQRRQATRGRQTSYSQVCQTCQGKGSVPIDKEGK